MIALRNIRLSNVEKNRLSRLKRKTGLSQWNILCRWAFCLSLAEKAYPQKWILWLIAMWRCLGGPLQALVMKNY